MAYCKLSKSDKYPSAPPKEPQTLIPVYHIIPKTLPFVPDSFNSIILCAVPARPDNKALCLSF